ncbi:hypothetical protein ADUPG1_008753 [Aduncisulcus paluster]|uniref:Ankyrin repeat protein n=1 Tax=Aduncisulcus paluster TaxID=2918883 RepID=A0ABQ5KT45_9EUKA|nr:hypothetical protein ADUPG1_008752 [Aduncisulcus paluster]GKT35636.1 hypothetical protein ADUPG1_008753 [Aduncisulcus paluster]
MQYFKDPPEVKRTLYSLFLSFVSSGDCDNVEQMLLHEGEGILHPWTYPSDHPIIIASRFGDLMMTELLFSFGSPLDVLGPDGSTPLHEALRNGHDDLVFWLVEQGADCGIPDGLGQTALHVAVRYSHIDIIRAICMGNRVSHEAVDSQGKTAAQWAKQLLRSEELKDLLGSPAKYDWEKAYDARLLQVAELKKKAKKKKPKKKKKKK